MTLMTMRIAVLLGAAAMAGSALAQEEAPDSSPMESGAAVSNQGSEAAETLSEDEMADLLNSQQQLQQTFTLRRTIDGEVVETEKRTITFDRDDPYRATEAGLSPRERLLAAFDGEALTRTEAYEEARLDFTVADADRDGAMTAEEFAALVDSWSERNVRQAGAPSEEAARQRQYEAFLAEISAEAAETQDEAVAKEKFAILSGGTEQLSRRAYIRAYMRDFDSMDADNDKVLRNEELLRFRALNRGETLEM